MTSTEDAVNALQEAIIAIENELGIMPSTVYANVRARLDVLEKRQSNQLVPSPNSENPFIVGTTGVTVSVGTGFPTEMRTPGSLYLREDGYVYEGLYAYRGDSAWHRIDTDPWVASGDLSGDYTSQTVVGLQNYPISTNAPTDGYRLTWNNVDGYWEPKIGFTAIGDLSGTVTHQTVIGIHDRLINSSIPNDNDYYSWDASNDYWIAEQLPIIFDPIHTIGSTNIRSNRSSTQSPIDNSKIGIVNFSSDSDLSTTGVSDNYSSILGGDRNQISTQYSTILGGSLNTISVNNNIVIGGGSGNLASALYSSILSGLNNTINQLADYSAIVGGKDNTTNGFYNYIGDGYENSVSGSYSTILNGSGINIGTASYASVINGENNTIIFDSNYSSIISGADNTINATFSNVISGDSVSVLSDHASVLNGKNIIVNAGSDFSIVLNSLDSSVIGNFSIISGASNGILTAGDGYSTILNGYSNIITSNYSLVHGEANNILGSSDYSVSLGNGHTITDSVYSFSNGNSNTIDGNYSTAFGLSNIIDLDYGVVFGKLGRSKFNGQVVHSSNAIDTSGTPGASQQSLVTLHGSGADGYSFNMYLPETSNHLSLDNNKSYDIIIRTLLVTTSGAYACARMIHNILLHVVSGNIVIDNTTLTLFSSSGAPASSWTMTIGSSTDELEIQIDSSGVEDRRAISTVEWRELLRT